MHNNFDDYMDYLEKCEEEYENDKSFSDGYIASLLLEFVNLPIYGVFVDTDGKSSELYVGKIFDLEVYENEYCDQIINGRYKIVGATLEEYQAYRNVHIDNMIKLDNLLYVEEDLEKLKSFCVWWSDEEN